MCQMYRSLLLVIVVFLMNSPSVLSADSTLDYLIQEIGDGDADRTINHLLDLMQQGNSTAMFVVGDYFFSINKIDDSLLLVKESASLGHPIAMKFLGTGYLKGSFGEADYAQAKKYFGLAASQRNINSLCYLGIIHRDGLGVERDILEAHKWFSIAGILKQVNQGDMEPEEFAHALELEMSEAAIARSLQLARSWIIDNPEGPAPSSIPPIEQKNDGPDTSYFNQGREAAIAGKFGEALKLLRPLAAFGQVQAQSLLGLMYFNGDGVTQDYEEAYRFLIAAGEKGDGLAQYQLGVVFRDGFGVLEDQKTSYDWFEKSARNNVSGAQFEVALLNMTGRGVEEDIMKGLTWAYIAYWNGSEESAALLESLPDDFAPAILEQVQENARHCLYLTLKKC